jgi:hypothetical protein
MHDRLQLFDVVYPKLLQLCVILLYGISRLAVCNRLLHCLGKGTVPAKQMLADVLCWSAWCATP